MAIRVASISFQALTLVLLANGISIVEVGIFSAIYGLWALLQNLGPMGLDYVSMRDISTFASRGDNARIQSISNFSVAVVVFCGLFVASSVLLLMGLFIDGGPAPVSTLTIAATALGAPAYMMNSLLAAQLRGFGKAILAQFPTAVGLNGLVMLFMAFLTWRGGLTLEMVVVTQAGCAWIVLLVNIALRIRCGIDIRAWLGKELRRDTLRDAFQIWQALAARGMAERVPTYLSLVLLGPAATAILDVARRFGGLPSLFTQGVSITFTPLFARLHAGNDREAYQRILAQSSWLAFLPAMATLAFLLLFGRTLLSLFFPPHYQVAYWPMVLISAGTTINAAFGLAGSNFMVTHRQVLVRKFFLYSLLTMVPGNIVLGHLFGEAGMAGAICISIIVCDGGLAWHLAREMGRPVMLDLAYFGSEIRHVLQATRRWSRGKGEMVGRDKPDSGHG